MPSITIALTDTQYKSLEYVTPTVQVWADNALHNRARLGQEEIIAALVAHCNENDITIATGVDAQVTQAFELGVVKTAAKRNEEALANSLPE